MKVKRMVKRLLALGAGVTMLGATVMGATAAADLNNYPDFFVTEGTFNGFLVVGENAAAVDNLAITDISNTMKYAATDAATTSVEGDAWMVGTAAKKLEITDTNSTAIGEQIYDVEQFISKDELGALADGSYSTTGSSSTYTQYLYFDTGNNNQNEIVVYVEDNDDVTADFLYIKSGENIGEYVLEFSSSPESTIQDTAGAASASGTVLDDYESTTLSMMGKDYDIVLARRPQSTPEDSIKLTMMGGSTSASLLEGDSTTLRMRDTDYEVSLSYVDSTYAKLTVNGESTDKLQKGDTYKLSSGTEVGISEILYQGYAGGVHSADFFVGASKVELRDNDVTSAASGESTLKVGTESISGADVNIEGSDDNTTFTLTKIRVNMTAQDDYYVPANGKLSDEILAAGDDKELVFTNNWDLEYLGLSEEETHEIKLASTTDRKYKLKWYDGDNNLVDMPFIYANTSSTIQLTEDATDKEVILNEALNISKNDYFVLSAGTASSGTAKSYALQYKGADKSTATSPKIKFKNLGNSETIEYAVDTSSSNTTATIKLGGYSFVVYANTAKTSNDFEIAIDLNGDGTFATAGPASAEVDIVDYYGMTIDFGGQLYQNVTGVYGPAALLQPLESAVRNAVEMNWTTENSNDYDTQYPALIEIVANATSTNEVTMTTLTIGGTSNPSITPEGEENIGYGYTTMGAMWTYTTPSGSPNEFSYEYPENQRLPQIYVTSGATSTSSAGGDLTRVEFVDATKLDSEVASADAQNLLVVGGPCVNTVAAELMDSGADCTEGFTQGKAVVKLWEHSNGNVAMLVAGYSGADTRLAGKVVANRASELSGMEVEIEGTTYSDATIGAPSAVVVEEVVEEVAEEVVEEAAEEATEEVVE